MTFFLLIGSALCDSKNLIYCCCCCFCCCCCSGWSTRSPADFGPRCFCTACCHSWIMQCTVGPSIFCKYYFDTYGHDTCTHTTHTYIHMHVCTHTLHTLYARRHAGTHTRRHFSTNNVNLHKCYLQQFPVIFGLAQLFFYSTSAVITHLVMTVLYVCGWGVWSVPWLALAHVCGTTVLATEIRLLWWRGAPPRESSDFSFQHCSSWV